MTALIRPSHEISLFCKKCKIGTKVLLWNGVDNYAMEPPQELMQERGLWVVVQVDEEVIDCFAEFADSLTHSPSQIILWMKNDSMYQTVLRLFTNKHQVHDMQSDTKH